MNKQEFLNLLEKEKQTAKIEEDTFEASITLTKDKLTELKKDQREAILEMRQVILKQIADELESNIEACLWYAEFEMMQDDV